MKDSPGAGHQPVRRFWLWLWAIALFLLLLPLMATLADRPVGSEVLLYFSSAVVERGRQFTREIFLLGTLKALLSLGALLFLVFHPLGARLLAWLEERGGRHLFAQLGAVAVGIALVTELVELPLAYYLGHLHEKAYGLSSATGGDWLRSRMLSTGMNLFLILGLWIPLYYLIRRAPRRWWLAAGLLQVAYTGLISFLYPVAIMPLFNKLVPAPEQVTTRIEQLAERVGVKVETVQVMKVSQKSSRMNAMVTGLGATKRVILYDTLLNQMKPDEVDVVIVHELAHAKHNDVMTGWFLSAGLTFGTLGAGSWLLRRSVGLEPLGLSSPHAARGFAVVILLLSLTDTLTSPVQYWASRRMEVRADQLALEMTQQPRAFISSFLKLAKGNPGDVDPPPVVEFLTHSHPSVMNRIRAAERWK